MRGQNGVPSAKGARKRGAQKWRLKKSEEKKKVFNSEFLSKKGGVKASARAGALSEFVFRNQLFLSVSVSLPLSDLCSI